MSSTVRFAAEVSSGGKTATGAKAPGTRRRRVATSVALFHDHRDA